MKGVLCNTPHKVRYMMHLLVQDTPALRVFKKCGYMKHKNVAKWSLSPSCPFISPLRLPLYSTVVSTLTTPLRPPSPPPRDHHTTTLTRGARLPYSIMIGDQARQTVWKGRISAIAWGEVEY